MYPLPKRAVPAGQTAATDEVRTEPTEMPQTDSAREFVTAVDSASVDTSFLQAVETGSSTAIIQSVAASATVPDQTITNASDGVLEQSIHHASLSEEAEHGETAVEPIGYSAQHLEC